MPALDLSGPLTGHGCFLLEETPILRAMRKVILYGLLVVALATPALADNYPASGRWGQSSGDTQGAIDCSGKRVIAFNGSTRTDTGGGVPAYQNRSVTPSGPTQYRIVDIFSTGQVRAGHVS